RTPAARSSSRSGAALARWAPAPSRAAVASAHQGGHGDPGWPSETKATSRAKETEYGTQDQTVALSRALYPQASTTATTCAVPAFHPERKERGMQAASATAMAVTASAGSGWQERTSPRTGPVRLGGGSDGLIPSIVSIHGCLCASDLR